MGEEEFKYYTLTFNLKGTVGVNSSEPHVALCAWRVTLNYAYCSPFTEKELFKYLFYVKDVMQGKLFQRCTHFLYFSVLSLGGKVNTRRMSQPDMEFIFTKIIYEIFWS